MVAIAIGMALLILFLNIIGMKKAARFQKILTCVIAAVGIALVAGSAYSGKRKQSSESVIGWRHQWRNYSKILQRSL